MILLTEKNNGIKIRNMWFASGAILSFSILFIVYYAIPEVLALLFAGFWIINESSGVIDSVSADSSDISMAIKTNDNEIGNADRIKTYKELLDSGVITKEEFEAKKKELLGL